METLQGPLPRPHVACRTDCRHSVQRRQDSGDLLLAETEASYKDSSIYQSQTKCEKEQGYKTYTTLL